MKVGSAFSLTSLVFIFFLFPTALLYRYDNSVYNLLTRYAYMTKISYCIDDLRDDHSLSSPVVLRPKPFLFLQGGYDENDYYGLIDNEEENIQIYVAKYLYSEAAISDISSSNPIKNTSVGFFAVDHRKNGTVTLALRGSANTRDYMTDVNVATVNYEPFHEDAKLKFKDCEDCKVHKGFYTRYKELAPDIFPTLEKLMDAFPTYQLVLTGHSLGGAIAILAGLELALLDYKPLVIGYGSPKVSNGPLATYIDKILFTDDLLDENVMEKEEMITDGYIRVVHRGDYVPLLPPGTTKFVQAGVEFFIDCEDLPHSKKSVIFNGAARNLSHKIDFNFWSLFSFDISKIFHHKEHSQYFYQLGTCDDLHESSVVQADTLSEVDDYDDYHYDDEEGEEEGEEEGDEEGDEEGNKEEHDQNYEDEDQYGENNEENSDEGVN